MIDEAASGVSVVIATRNRPRLARLAVDAALAQEHPGPIEVILVFDQADPDPAFALDESHRRVRVITNVRRPGLAGARNSGILASTMPLVAFSDDDDVWLPGKLARQIETLTVEDAEVCYTGIEIDTGRRRTPRSPAADELALGPLLRRRVVAAHPSTLLVTRRALLDVIGLVDEDIPGSYGEDYDWLLRAVKLSRVAVVEEPLVRVRWSGQSYFADRWQTIIDANHYLVDKHPEFRDEPVAMARLAGREAIAQMALGRRRQALRSAGRALRRNPRDARALLALLLGTRLIRVDQVMRLANHFGRGL